MALDYAGTLLGAGALLVSGIGAATTWRGRHAHQRLENASASKAEGEAGVSVEDKKKIAAEAAKINSDERIETERWWKEQFDAVKAQLLVEFRWRRKVTEILKAHAAWDRRTIAEMRRHNLHVTDPPPLDVNGEDEQPSSLLFGLIQDDEKPSAAG